MAYFLIGRGYSSRHIGHLATSNLDRRCRACYWLCVVKCPEFYRTFPKLWSLFRGIQDTWNLQSGSGVLKKRSAFQHMALRYWNCTTVVLARHSILHLLNLNNKYLYWPELGFQVKLKEKCNLLSSKKWPGHFFPIRHCVTLPDNCVVLQHCTPVFSKLFALSGPWGTIHPSDTRH